MPLQVTVHAVPYRVVGKRPLLLGVLFVPEAPLDIRWAVAQQKPAHKPCSSLHNIHFRLRLEFLLENYLLVLGSATKDAGETLRDLVTNFFRRCSCSWWVKATTSRDTDTCARRIIDQK